MAIIIPSANIFGSPNLYKIKDNYIDKIEVNANSVASNNEYDVSVQDITITSNFQEDTIIQDYESMIETSFGISTISCAYVSLKPIYMLNATINISKNQGNTYISKIYRGVDSENENNIKATYYSKKYTGTASAYATKNNIISNTINTLYSDEGDVTTSFENPILTNSEGSGEYVATAKISFNDTKTNIGSAYFTETPTSFSITLTLLVGYENILLNSSWLYEDNIQIPLSGTCTKYVPQKVEITFYGETLSIDLTETTISLGESNGENPYSIDNNELLQTENYYGSEEQNAIESGYNKTLEIYKNGLESAEITCSISKYYDQNGEIKIRDDITSQDVDVSIYARYRDTLGLRYFTLYINSPLDYDLYIFYNVHTGTLSVPGSCVIQKGDTAVSAGTGSSVLSSTIGISRKYKKYSMTFNIGDLVIPMIYSNNKDVPISINGNGNAKVFRVIGKKIKYDGAVWQVLSLQEYKEVI